MMNLDLSYNRAVKRRVEECLKHGFIYGGFSTKSYPPSNYTRTIHKYFRHIDEGGYFVQDIVIRSTSTRLHNTKPYFVTSGGLMLPLAGYGDLKIMMKHNFKPNMI